MSLGGGGSPLGAAVAAIVHAARSADRLRRIEAVVRDLAIGFHALGTLVHEEDDDEVLLHAEPTLTIYHITLSPGLQYPPHDHLLDALIGIYLGDLTRTSRQLWNFDGTRAEPFDNARYLAGARPL